MGECNREIEFAERLTKTEALAKSNQHRLDDVERRQDALDSMATSLAVMTEKQSVISDKVESIDSKVSAIEQKPGKRWDGIVDKIIWLIVGAAIAALFAKGGITL